MTGRGAGRAAQGVGIPLLLWVLGTAWLALVVSGPGLARMPGDPGDTRLILLVLEHSYQWLTAGVPLWDPGVFFPAPNVLAYSDVLLGVAPPYWLWRLVGAGPHVALLLWLLTVLSLDYAAALAWLRHGLGLGAAPSAVGAFVVAFSMARQAQLIHLQLMGQFWTLLSLLALSRLLREPRAPSARGWALLAALGLVAELWSGFYLAWFAGFVLALSFLLALALPGPRDRLKAALRGQGPTLLAAAVGGGLLLVPLARHYLATASDLGMRTYDAVAGRLPTPLEWLDLGSSSWLWGGWMGDRTVPLGLGVATVAAGVGGLWTRRGAWAPVALAGLLAAALMTRWPGGLEPWKLVFGLVPGADALRDLARLNLVLLLPLAAGTAIALERVARWRLGVGVALAALVVAEQARTVPTYPRAWSEDSVAELAQLVRGQGCSLFFYSPVVGAPAPEDPWWTHHWVRFQTDAMLVAVETGVPTVNGYQGNLPAGWVGLRDPAVRSDDDVGRLNAELVSWLGAWDVPPGDLCWLRIAPEQLRPQVD